MIIYFYPTIKMELPIDIATACENACSTLNNFKRNLSDPDMQMNSFFIDKMKSAEAILKSHNLTSYLLPNQSLYPQLYTYMLNFKEIEERNKKREEEKMIKEASYEFQLEKKEVALREADNNILKNIQRIASLEAQLKEANDEQRLLADLYLQKSLDLANFKASYS